MKRIINKTKRSAAFLVVGLLMLHANSFAQDSTAIITATQPDIEVAKPAKAKPVKNTFESVWLIDNQTVLVPVKGTMEMDIQHRFGVINNGYKDFWGFFAPSNIRLGMSYAPLNKLFVGIGITKGNMLVDLNAKYSLITQTKGKYPVSVTWYGNVARDTRRDDDGTLFKHSTDRYSFFNQLIIARKLTDKISVQVAPSISHQNSVNGYYTKNDSTGTEIFKEMKNDHIAIAFSTRIKITNVTSILLNYDQPITKHNTNNPDPNLSFGFQFNSSSHSFQVFLGNYSYLNPQRNNLFNVNSPFGTTDLTKTHPDRYADDPATPQDESTKVRGGRFVIGFNITRLWNY
ncbi:hypothetical protein BH09BAC2_BH09BAC2_16230 [soil metagenome]